MSALGQKRTFARNSRRCRLYLQKRTFVIGSPRSDLFYSVSYTFFLLLPTREEAELRYTGLRRAVAQAITLAHR